MSRRLFVSNSKRGALEDSRSLRVRAWAFPLLFAHASVLPNAQARKGRQDAPGRIDAPMSLTSRTCDPIGGPNEAGMNSSTTRNRFARQRSMCATDNDVLAWPALTRRASEGHGSSL